LKYRPKLSVFLLRTGPGDCSNSLCGFLKLGKLFESLTVDVDYWVDDDDPFIIPVVSLGTCSNMTMVAVGSGGDAGAGSGRVEVWRGKAGRQLEVVVGHRYEEPDSQVWMEDVLILRAEGGEDGNWSEGDGGSGYSGGGGFGGDGGSDGGNGKGGEWNGNATSGGVGSGLDVASIELTNFYLE
jgi:uncharacterized membrane protein YgcG